MSGRIRVTKYIAGRWVGIGPWFDERSEMLLDACSRGWTSWDGEARELYLAVPFAWERERGGWARVGLPTPRPAPRHRRSLPYGDDPRHALEAAVAAQGQSLADISAVLGRSRSYAARFVREGVPRELNPDQVRRAALYLGVAESDLGVRDYWSERSPAAR